MALLENINRGLAGYHVRKQIHIVFRPELLRLLKQEARLNRWIVLLGILQLPVLFAALSA